MRIRHGLVCAAVFLLLVSGCGKSDSGGSGAPRDAPNSVATASFTGLGDLAGGAFLSVARGVSDDGSIVAGYASSSASGFGSFEAFRWTQAGGMVGLGDLAGGEFNSQAYDVSANGSVVVGLSLSAPGTQAFRWTESEGMVGLGDLGEGAFHSAASSVSADGSVVAGRGNSASGFEAMRWTSEGGMVSLGDLAGGDFDSGALDISADGSVIVGYVDLNAISGNDRKAFIWDATSGMLNLEQVLMNKGIDLTGWSLRAAHGVSADGLTIIGQGINPSGFDEAWIATIPEPSTGLLPALGLTCLAARRRPNHRRPRHQPTGLP